jgi:molecular chaperone GrpE
MTDPTSTPDVERELPVPDLSAGAGGDSVASATSDAPADVPSDAATAALQNAERLLDDQKDKYLRLFAEFENFRRRSARERMEAEQKGMGTLITDLLDSLDDLGRVAHFDPATTPAQAIAEGILLVEKKVLKSLASHGLTVVNPVGERFDPAVHEALTAIPATAAEEDETVAQVYQVGYTLNGQLLRPARVVVKQWNG